MPVVRELFPCAACEKTHILYLPHGTAPDLGRQLYYICPKIGFAVRVTKADGWKPVDAKPVGAVSVVDAEMNNRVGA